MIEDLGVKAEVVIKDVHPSLVQSLAAQRTDEVIDKDLQVDFNVRHILTCRDMNV